MAKEAEEPLVLRRAVAAAQRLMGSQELSPRPVQMVAAQEQFWHSYIRIGFVICMVEAALTLIYLDITPRGEHRLLLTAMASAFAFVAGLSLVTVSNRVAQATWRRKFAFSWAMGASAMATVCAGLDGGVDSPIILLVLLPVMFAGLGLSPQLTTACACAGIAELAVVAFTGGSVRLDEPTLLMLFAIVVGAGFLAVTVSVYRARLQREEKAAFDEVDRLSKTDALTGCVSQGLFHARLEEEVERSIRYGNELSLLVMDVDLFKSFNDAHGHDAGDSALAAVGSVLRSASRTSDVVGRIGGDEFAILMPDTRIEGAETFAHRLVERFASGEGAGATLSIGVSNVAQTRRTATALFRSADAALYEAKTRGRARLSSARLLESPDAQDVAAKGRRADVERAQEAARQARREAEEALTVLDTLLASAPVGFVFVDRDMRYVRVNQVIADTDGLPIEAYAGRLVSEVVPELWPHLEPLYRHVLETGVAVVNREIPRLNAETREVERYWLESFYPVRVRGAVIGVGGFILDITDRRRLEEANEDLTYTVATALGSMAELRDPYTAGHQQRVGRLAGAIAAELGLDPQEVRGIEIAGSIHDIGKVAVPAELLSKPGKLSEAERDLVRTHATASYRVLAGINFPWPICDMVGQHHERVNGSGYPAGLKGDEINLGARIIAVADVIDAMSSRRPYRESLPFETVLTALQDGRGTLFDPDVLDAALRLVKCGRIEVGRV